MDARLGNGCAARLQSVQDLWSWLPPGKPCLRARGRAFPFGKTYFGTLLRLRYTSAMTAAKTSTPTAIWCGCIDSDASLIQFQDFMDGKLRLERWRRALINGGEIMRGAEQTPGVRGCAPLLAQVDGDDLVGSIRGRFRQSCWSILAVARKGFGRGRPRRQQGAGRPRRVLRGRVARGKIAGAQAGPEDQEHTGSSRSRSLRLPDAAAHDSYSVAQEALALRAVCVIGLAGQFPNCPAPRILADQGYRQTYDAEP